MNTNETFIFNQFLLDNVDHEGSSYEVDCPECGKQAKERQFESCVTGSVNQHSSIDCKHCGYHECDCDECDTCNSLMSACDTDAFHRELMLECRQGEALTDLFNSVLESVSDKGFASPVTWSLVKHLAFNTSGGIDYCDIEGVDYQKPQSFVPSLKRLLLDAKFGRNLELKIAQAKQDLN